MYTTHMQNHTQEINNLMATFNRLLNQVRSGSRTLDTVKTDIQNVLRDLRKVRIAIKSEIPPQNLTQIHNTILKAARFYERGVKEFLKLYDDGDDDHMVYGGQIIMEANNLMNEAARMM